MKKALFGKLFTNKNYTRRHHHHIRKQKIARPGKNNTSKVYKIIKTL